MNRLLALVLAFAMIFIVAGCGNSSETITDDKDIVSNSGDAVAGKDNTTDGENGVPHTEEEELTPEEQEHKEAVIQEVYDEMIEKAVLVKRSDFIKRHDEAVIADGLDERNCLEKNPVTVSEKSDIPEFIINTYPDASKRYRYSMGVSKDGVEFMSADVFTDADDNVLYFSYQLLGEIWDSNEDVRNLYMSQCGQLFGGFIDSTFEDGYEKVVAAYNAALSSEEQTYSYWNEYRYFMTNSADGSYVGFVIQAPFVE